MSADDWAFVVSIAGPNGFQKLLASMGWEESHWGKDGQPGGPSSRDWILNYGYEDTQVLSQYKGFANQIQAAVQMLANGFQAPITYASILAFAQNYWRCDNPTAWAQGVWAEYNALVNDLSYGMVVIKAGGTVIYGTDTGGVTWGPLAQILTAKGIPYTWNAATRTLVF